MHIRTLFFSFLFVQTAFSLESGPTSYWDVHPLHAGGQFLRIGKADCQSGQEGNLHYRKSAAFATLLVPLNHHNFFFPKVEINYVTFDWNKNTKFSETHFYYMQFGLTYYTNAIERWKWIARFDYNLQIEHVSHPGLYSLYNGMLWGAYEINSKWNYHLGGLGYWGLEGGTFYPLIGLDYKLDEKWFFQAIFPFAYSIEYKFAPEWTLAAKGRPLKERLRVGSREPQPRSILNYSSMGYELNLSYKKERRLTIEAYAGYNSGGKFYIKDEYGHNATYVKFGGAPYLGASLDFGF